MFGGVLDLWRNVPQLKWGFYMVVVVLALSAFSKWAESDKPKYSKDFVSQSSAAAKEARDRLKRAKYDPNTLSAFEDVAMARGALMALRKVTSDHELERITGYDVSMLLRQADALRETKYQSVVSEAPTLDSSGVPLTSTAWEEGLQK